MIEVYCDGGARGNPGPAAWGFVVLKDNQLVMSGSGYIGVATNNVAEYTAVVEALKGLKSKFNGKNLKFNIDSQLVAMQLSGLFKIKNSRLRELIIKIRTLETSFKQISYNQIPRSQNTEADKLVNLELDKRINRY